MNGCERIPVKTKVLALTGAGTEVDCEGLEVTVYADGGDVCLKTVKSVSDSDAFVIANGSCLTLGGRFVLSGTSGKARLLFCRLL